MPLTTKADNRIDCKFCLQPGQGCKAHIIPAAFYRALAPVGPDPLLLHDITKDIAARSPTGAYDARLVCVGCEKRWQDWDTYGANFLIHRLNAKSRQYRDERGRLIGYDCEPVDHRILKLFVISLLWRMSATSNAFFEHLTFGPYADVARQCILDEDPGDDSVFPMTFHRWITSAHNPPYIPPIIAPAMTKFPNGARAIKIYLGQTFVLVKTDRRSTPELQPHKFRRGTRLLVTVVDYDTSGERQHFEAHNRRYFTVLHPAKTPSQSG